MNKKYIYLSAVGAILIALVILRIVNNSAEGAKRTMPVPVVVISKPARIAMTSSGQYNGDIAAIQQAVIYPKVSGTIEKTFADIGSFVRQGQVLALIDSTIYSQNCKQANASYLQAEANLLNAKLTYERNKNLFEQNLVSKQDYDNSKAAFEIASAQKELTLASFRNAQTQLGYCRITAPFGGFITKRYLDAGAYVSASGTQAGSMLFMLMDIETVKIIANIPEKSISSLKDVKNVIISADGLPGQKFEGKISKASQALDLSTRTLAIEIDIPNAGHLLKPGMFASIQLITETKTNVLSLPLDAVLNDAKGGYVFTVGADTVARKSYVATGITEDGNIEIVSGLDESSRVIVTGQSLIKENSKVRAAR